MGKTERKENAEKERVKEGNLKRIGNLEIERQNKENMWQENGNEN